RLRRAYRHLSYSFHTSGEYPSDSIGVCGTPFSQSPVGTREVCRMGISAFLHYEALHCYQ
ncbi:hypothetical protein, partial [Endozoicomonas sp. YOMI1]|uniref:hypothetical protein n=1 Tax=Endozoicomonas sp. YOMI1 TaxID=2828739 RepID=UPI00214884FB